MSGRLWVSGLYKYGDGISMRAMTLEEHYVTPGFLEGRPRIPLVQYFELTPPATATSESRRLVFRVYNHHR